MQKMCLMLCCKTTMSSARIKRTCNVFTLWFSRQPVVGPQSHAPNHTQLIDLLRRRSWLKPKHIYDIAVMSSCHFWLHTKCWGNKQSSGRIYLMKQRSGVCESVFWIVFVVTQKELRSDMTMLYCLWAKSPLPAFTHNIENGPNKTQEVPSFVRCPPKNHLATYVQSSINHHHHHYPTIRCHSLMICHRALHLDFMRTQMWTESICQCGSRVSFNPSGNDSKWWRALLWIQHKNH